MGLLKKLFGDYSSKEIKRIQPTVNKVLSYEDEYAALSDAELKAKTNEFKKRLANGETLDDILPEAFAVCREASWRVLGMKHFPVQIEGGIVLHQGRIAEMKTGEGKTLVATLPAYLNALSGKGVHIVTVNDYLARRDSEWMGKVYRYLGLTVGLIVNGLETDDRRAAYAADITYGTNNEMGFDYLRDNMVQYIEQKVQRGHNFAVVDEVDSILIDEARTPLIISGMGEQSSQLYSIANNFVKGLKCLRIAETDSKMNLEDIAQENGADYVVDEKAKNATLTKSGIAKAERFFNVENLSDPENLTLSHHINIAIKAHGIMKRDIDYVVKDGQVLIVDEFTGRIMIGRRYNEGLHQAIEAKENVKIAKENKTLATITFQNYFRLYEKLSGMTGTAMTEVNEFREIYSLDAVEIPTNKPVRRIDNDDVIYKTEQFKFNAIIDQIIKCHEKGQPVLVGTVSIEKSEKLSSALKKRGVKHNVLNAKFHEKEAEIIAQAGKLGAVTIATNMAGRGTDIMLGGNAEYLAKSEMRRLEYPEELIAEATGFGETDNDDIIEAREKFKELEAKYKAEIKDEADQVREAGGLYIIGTERHESRRIDNQLRGRSGRQGDPGESRFYLSMEDDLLRLFGGDRMAAIMNSLPVDNDMPIEVGILSKQVENAQKKVEGNNFAVRRHVLSFDDVMNRQREVIYGQRDQVLKGEDMKKTISKMIDDSITDTVAFFCSPSVPSNEWHLASLREKYMGWLTTENDFVDNNMTAEELLDMLCDRAHDLHEEREEHYGTETMREIERAMLLRCVDLKWMDHIDAVDELKKGINLVAYGQKDPVIAFREESADMFDAMISSIREDTVRIVLSAEFKTDEEIKREQVAKVTGASGSGDGSEEKKPVKKGKKIGPNDPCPCGSGKKYKKCCGRPGMRNEQ
ncbi:MAG: preprotein translocase subunit SecA [Faecalibacterium sp.]|nr:preprotein translocase subunit SecA [Ruminococcus sp.]MCM1392581.1 preprotein translocase subunit SecA [Ruminococcus sp.]MCM1486273.1 preprotein translocase subunit SecA [Faecalibacterium sp.]